MENFIGISITVILFVIGYIAFVNVKKRRKRAKLMQIIKADWDNVKVPEEDVLAYIKDVANMSNYYDNDEAMRIDDITWNDFEMDGIFDQLNYTYSAMGEVCLYRILRNPTKDIQVLKERDRITEYFLNNEADRLKKQYQLNNIGKANRVSIYIYRDLIESVGPIDLKQHIIMPVLQLLSIILLVLDPKIGIAVFCIILSMNIITYYKEYKKIEIYHPLIMQIGSMLHFIKEMDDRKENEELSKYSAVLSQTAKISRIYKRYYRFFGNLTLGILPDIDMLYDSFLKPFLHADIIVFCKLIRFVKKNMQLLVDSYETVGFLDSMIAIAAYRHKMGEIQNNPICKPEFCNDRLQYSAEDIYNPLIKNFVTNSIDTGEPVLITGSNATGKSTFLRTVGVNALLAQTIYTVCGARYYASMFMIMSSMSLRDSILNGESYYMAEIKALKRIIDAINSEMPILCCIDEVLRGTNTIERIAASSKILENLSKRNVLCFAASHDLELTYIVEKYYKNYHFQEKVDSNGLVCDFKLYGGRSYTRNAINLLKFIGYSDDIVEDAKNRANRYIESGNWV